MKPYISFVVDALPTHYFQAELLLHSLAMSLDYPKEKIVVQCLSRVDDRFITYLKDNGYTYTLIEPYLDGKYCNKLQQLAYFTNIKDADVILLDTDTFILHDLEYLSEFSECVAGKVVDGPNPVIESLKSIYSSAGLPAPKVVQSDIYRKDNLTFENNFNGGFYWIPNRFVSTMEHQWKKWASWLFEREALFTHPHQFMHVDQISFSLALTAAKVPYKLLTANNNCPVHTHLTPDSLDTSIPVGLLHYHNELNVFGLINSNKITNSHIKTAIDQANTLILKKEHYHFFSPFKHAFITAAKMNDKLVDLDKKLQVLTTSETQKTPLILHAGTPKTGTTSIQFFLDNNRALLEKNRYLYPNDYHNDNVPKHQWLVSLLKQDDFKTLFLHLEQAYKDANGKTIILSTEGIYNHWWDFSNEAKMALKIIAKYFDLSLWIFFRTPLSFMESFYRQNLKNPQNSAAQCYGKDLSFSEMLQDSWFQQRLDYLGFIYHCEQLFNKENVRVFNYSENTLEEFLKALHISVDLEKVPQHNLGQSSAAVELLRIINRYDLNATDKREAVKQLSVLDKTLHQYANKSLIDTEAKEHIEGLSALNAVILREDYQLKF